VIADVTAALVTFSEHRDLQDGGRGLRTRAASVDRDSLVGHGGFLFLLNDEYHIKRDREAKKDAGRGFWKKIVAKAVIASEATCPP
jgi:hypothetical protein